VLAKEKSTVDGPSFLLDHPLVDGVLLHGEAECDLVGIGDQEVEVALDVHIKCEIIYCQFSLAFELVCQ
jgi:hypothetical protein